MSWALQQTSISFDPVLVVGVAVFAIVVGLLSVVAREFLLNALEELGRLAREISPGLSAAILRRRTERPLTEWFCSRCLSHNGPAMSRCYSCGARRTESEAVSGAEHEPPAEQRAGLTRRR